MKKTITIAAVVIIAGAGIYYFASKNAPAGNQNLPAPVNAFPASQTPAAPVSNIPAATTAPASIAISIKNFSFNPASLTVKTGTKVTWTNNDTAPHTVTSDSGNFPDSGMLPPGQSFSFTFTKSGSVNYHCSIHPNMKGVIVVEN